MRGAHTLPLVLFFCCGVACAADGPDDPGPVAAPSAAPVGSARPDGKADGARIRTCTGGFKPAPAKGWRHRKSRIASALARPVHAANDVIVKPGQTATLKARLAYGGLLSKELEDEWVWVFLDDCTSWRYVGYARTNDEGRVRFDLAPGLPAGRYDVRMEVVGDATTVPLTLWVLPAGTHVSVFDIDGTLTTDDSQLWNELLTGRTPSAYPAAPDVTWAEQGRGAIVVYLTGRPEILAGVTRGWLGALGFAPGAVHLARTAAEVLPKDSGVGAYKLAYLQALQGSGYIVDDAFGNASTDVYAYAGARVPTARTFIIGPNAGSSGTQPVTGGWAAVAARLEAEPPVSQPFSN